MTMTIEKIEFPRRETKQSKSKKSLTIDSDDEPLETIGEIDPVIEQLKADKSLEPEHSLEDDKSFETEEPQKPDRSSASLELSATENSNVPNDQLKIIDEKPTTAPIVLSVKLKAPPSGILF